MKLKPQPWDDDLAKYIPIDFDSQIKAQVNGLHWRHDGKHFKCEIDCITHRKYYY